MDKCVDQCAADETSKPYSVWNDNQKCFDTKGWGIDKFFAVVKRSKDFKPSDIDPNSPDELYFAIKGRGNTITQAVI